MSRAGPDAAPILHLVRRVEDDPISCGEPVQDLRVLVIHRADLHRPQPHAAPFDPEHRPSPLSRTSAPTGQSSEAGDRRR